jgi:hypothetical protein
VIPFIVMLYCADYVSKSLLMSRVIWLAYAVYYFILFLYQWGTSSAGWALDDTLYLAAVIVGIIVFLMIQPIRGWVWEGKLQGKVEMAERDLDKRLELEKLRKKEAQQVFDFMKE